MLLARKGYRVLLVDRNEFPSDTISTQMIHPPGVARLHVLERSPGERVRNLHSAAPRLGGHSHADDLTLVVLGWPHAEFEANKKDVEGAYLKTLELAPAFAERVCRARREAPFRGGPVSSFFRRPFGPGWALVGDAGYNKDPVTAWGISDAFRDAEGCAEARSRFRCSS